MSGWLKDGVTYTSLGSLGLLAEFGPLLLQGRKNNSLCYRSEVSSRTAPPDLFFSCRNKRRDGQ